MSGRMVGSLIAAVFGVVFVVVNSGGLPAALRIILIMLALAVGCLVLVRAILSRGGEGYAGPTRELGRWFWPTVAIEIVAIVGGIFLLNRFTSIGWAGVAWVALVVGLHFIPFAINTKLPLFTMLSIALSILGVAGLILAFTGAAPVVVETVAGVLSGFTLLGAAAYAVLNRHAAAAKA